MRNPQPTNTPCTSSRSEGLTAARSHTLPRAAHVPSTPVHFESTGTSAEMRPRAREASQSERSCSLLTLDSTDESDESPSQVSRLRRRRSPEKFSLCDDNNGSPTPTPGTSTPERFVIFDDESVGSDGFGEFERAAFADISSRQQTALERAHALLALAAATGEERAALVLQVSSASVPLSWREPGVCRPELEYWLPQELAHTPSQDVRFPRAPSVQALGSAVFDFRNGSVAQCPPSTKDFWSVQENHGQELQLLMDLQQQVVAMMGEMTVRSKSASSHDLYN